MTTLRPTTLRRFAPAFALALFALAADARAQGPAPEAPAPQESLAPTGSGTAGKIPKWTAATNLGNSIMTESAGRVGVNVAAPTARLHVFGPTPPAVVAADGTDAPLLFRTTGGRGGDTAAGFAGLRAGDGASISLYAGRGGDAGFGSRGGDGGTIFIQPGLAGGGGGVPGSPGKVLIAPAGVGSVGVGTFSPAARLHVKAKSDAVRGESGSGFGVFGISPDGRGVFGQSTSGIGVSGYSVFGSGVFGESGGGSGVLGLSISGNGVFGASTTGHAGYFVGKARVTGNLQVASCTGCTTAPSDRALKANVSAVDPRSVLERLAAVPIREWNYKSDSPSVRHLGPLAQDFHAAFDLGADDRHIDLMDANGVALASIQALYQQNKELATEVRQLRAQVLRQQAQLNQVRRAVRGKRAARR